MVDYKLDDRHEYCFQTYIDPDGSGKRWVDVPMHPPGVGNSESALSNRDIWVAYLNYIRVIQPDDKYRLTETTISTTVGILDV